MTLVTTGNIDIGLYPDVVFLLENNKNFEQIPQQYHPYIEHTVVKGHEGRQYSVYMYVKTWDYVLN